VLQQLQQWQLQATLITFSAAVSALAGHPMQKNNAAVIPGDNSWVKKYGG